MKRYFYFIVKDYPVLAGKMMNKFYVNFDKITRNECKIKK